MRGFVRLSAKNKGAMQTMYYNPEETKKLLAIGGAEALILMQHYVAIAKQSKPNMEDAVLANILDMKPRAIERIRLVLTKAGWFKRIKTTIKNETHILYAVGPEAVQSCSNGKSAILID